MPTEIKGPEALVKHWLNEIRDSLKREKKYREEGRKCVNLYEAKDTSRSPFAILYSNTEVLAPSVYNSRPIPIVTRRFRDEDPIGKAVAEVCTRLLKFLIDVEDDRYDSFDEIMQPVVLDGLIVNRGLCRFKYTEASFGSECVYAELVRWDKFSHGYARTWKKVPWCQFEWEMTEDELKKNFPDITFDLTKALMTEDEDDQAESREERTGVKLFKVHEVWDKTSKKVRFISDAYPKGPMKEVDDPLDLVGFFPVPKPLNFMRKVTTLVPTPLYEQYRQQAQELNEVTRRLKHIIRSIRYRGAYNSIVEGIADMLKAEENELIPVENVASMPEGTAMDKLLWIVPVAELAQTAQQLYQHREAVKQTIYEITGISDILRGSTTASETATAQQIKNQWGTLRLKKMQKEVQRYCRESLAIILEIAAKRFDLQTIVQMTGLNYPTNATKQQAQAQFQVQAQQAAIQAQMTGQQAQPMQPPPELQQLLSTPSWEDIYAVISNDLALTYKVEIETNSTIDAEASQDKQDISELLNALSQFLNGIAPLVQSGTLPFDIAKNMLLVISRRYNFGSQLEDALNRMAAPPQQGPEKDPNAEIKAQAEAAKAKAAIEQLQMEGQLAAQEHQFKMDEMAAKAQLEREKIDLERQSLALQSGAVRMKLQQQAAQHSQKMAQIEAQKKEPADAAV